MVISKRFALALAGCLGAVASLHAELTWEAKQVTVEAAFGQPSLEAVYSFKNTGTVPVRVVEVKTSCGCTYAAASQELVKPGESAEVAAFFETEGREGPQHSTITVLTDEKDHRETVLSFRTDIPPAASLPTRAVKWSAADAREPKTLLIPVEAGVSLQLLPPKRPLPVAVKLEKADLDGKPGYHLTLTPLDGEKSGSGILPIEAHWGEGQSRLYNIYVRL
ncbi:MAG: DUF1573 domain-containing protein [Verrucomicrobiota bacterium JB024]|nr:DUF1573 domain-containing protein [Verrucomicrobiota bacterium JB024]